MDKLAFLFNDSMPVRRALKHLIARAGIGSFRFRYTIEALQRYHYAYTLFQAADLAHRLGLKEISAIEFGVAGGNGLLWMERHAEEIEKLVPVRIHIYGFDTGAGLPPPADYRDLPYFWQAGDFEMDVPALRKRLKRAELVIGPVAETVGKFVDRLDVAPIAVVAHDMDFYTSTRDGLKLFDAPPEKFLPRLWCYFDDTMGTARESYNDHTGERLAIHEFNHAHDDRKIGIPYHLRGQDGLGGWRHQVWVMHFFQHPLYGRFIGEPGQQLPLSH